MARKDSEKDSERPHYYSQFWLDVAAGRRTIGSPKTGEDGEIMEPDLDMDEPVTPLRSIHADGTGYRRYDEEIAHPDVELLEEEEEELEEEPFDEVEEEEAEVDEPVEVDDSDIPTILMDNVEAEAVADADTEAPEVEAIPLEEAEENFFDEDEEEEDEEGWSAGRGRKKPKPGRQTRVPAPKKAKRERRSY